MAGCCLKLVFNTDFAIITLYVFALRKKMTIKAISQKCIVDLAGYQIQTPFLRINISRNFGKDKDKNVY